MGFQSRGIGNRFRNGQKNRCFFEVPIKTRTWIDQNGRFFRGDPPTIGPSAIKPAAGQGMQGQNADFQTRWAAIFEALRNFLARFFRRKPPLGPLPSAVFFYATTFSLLALSHGASTSGNFSSQISGMQQKSPRKTMCFSSKGL